MQLTAKIQAEFQALLTKRENTLNEDIRREQENQEDIKQAAGEVPDVGDQATADVMVTLNQAEVRRDMGELKEIAAARIRLADGTYGQCVDCGTDIPLDRLRVQPTAQRCIGCQTVREKTYAQETGGAPLRQ